MVNHHWQGAGSGARQENERGQPTTPSKQKPKKKEKDKREDEAEANEAEAQSDQQHSGQEHNTGQVRTQNWDNAFTGQAGGTGKYHRTGDTDINFADGHSQQTTASRSAGPHGPTAVAAQGKTQGEPVMAGTLDQPTTPSASRAPRRINGKVPPGCKTIQVIVPDKLYYHVQTQASLSCMDPPDYLYHFLQEAFPLPAPSSQQPTGAVPAQEQ